MNDKSLHQHNIDMVLERFSSQFEQLSNKPKCYYSDEYLESDNKHPTQQEGITADEQLEPVPVLENSDDKEESCDLGSFFESVSTSALQVVANVVGEKTEPTRLESEAESINNLSHESGIENTLNAANNAVNNLSKSLDVLKDFPMPQPNTSNQSGMGAEHKAVPKSHFHASPRAIAV